MIHDFNKRLERALKRLENICEENQKLILKFKSYCFANDLSLARVSKLIEQLVKISEVVNKPFTDWQREDVEKVLEWIDERIRKENLSLWTKREYKKTLKEFFRWLGKKELVDWFTIGEMKTRKFPDELITEDELKKMIEAAKNPRDWALISVLWESGCRVEELGNMRVRDVEFTDEGVWVKLFGKTGESCVVTIFYSLPL